MSPTADPRAGGRLRAGGVLWCAGWAALAATAVLPALGGGPRAVTWALTTAVVGMALLVLAPAAELSIVRTVVVAAPMSAAAAWVPVLLSMPFWLVVVAAAAGTGWCVILAARLVAGARTRVGRSFW
jgi:hypothetical protein